MAISAKLRQEVARRACQRCEYCGLSAEGQAATFHVDHVVPQIAGGPSIEANLALACVHCSLRKGARRTAVDPKSGKSAPFFNPRLDSWSHHFYWKELMVVGKTAVGRATVAVLQLNRTEHLIIRGFESRLGRHPPPTKD